MAVQGILGIAAIILIAWIASERRRPFPVRTVMAGLAVQAALALILLKIPVIRDALGVLNGIVGGLQAAAGAGTSLVFGYLGGGVPPFEVTRPEAMFILAFQALPLVLIVSALSAVLWHWGILPRVIGGFSWLLRRALGVRGEVGLAAAANVFVGMVEAPLLIRPTLARLSRADLFMVMTAGMATIAGTVLVLYATVLGEVLPNAAGHLVTASVINAPAALMLAAIMVPEAEARRPGEEDPEGEAGLRYESTMEALTRGTGDGLALLLNIVALLIVLVALVALVDQILGLLPAIGGAPLSLARMLDWIFVPFAWLLGVPWSEAEIAGRLLGTKIVLNEYIAYLDLAAQPADALGARTRLIVSYALCGFANFGSLGIMLGGFLGMAPARRADILALAPRTLVSGTLATSLTGALAGLLA